MPIQAPLFSAAPGPTQPLGPPPAMLHITPEVLARRGFRSVDRLHAARRRADAENQPSRSDLISYDAGHHNRSRNRARNWVHSRIWPSRDYFLSTPSTRKTAIVLLLSFVCRTARPAAAPHGPNDFGDLPPLAVLKQYADGVAISREDPQSSNGDRTGNRRRDLGHSDSYLFGGIAVGGASISAFRLALSCSSAAWIRAIA